MTSEDILTYFYTNSANLGIKRISIVLFACLLICILISAIYYLTGRGAMFNGKFCTTLISLGMISAVIMLMISSNIVISLGMVGALSIVRFRTAIKDARDTVYIFWCIAEGLSVGSQNFKLALVSTLFISIVMMLLQLMPYERGNYIVIVRGTNDPVDAAEISNVLSQFARKVKLRASNIDEDHKEFIYQVHAKGKEIDSAFASEIYKISGVKSVNWVIESGENVG